MFEHTPPRTARISGLKSQLLKRLFLAKNDGEKWSRIFYFKIKRAPSEIPANLPGQFSLSEQSFFALGSRNSEKAHSIKKKKIDHFSPSFLAKNSKFKS